MDTIPTDACSDGLMTTAEAARFLKVSKTYLYRLIKTGDLPTTRMGSRTHIPRRALVAFAMRRTTKGAKE